MSVSSYWRFQNFQAHHLTPDPVETLSHAATTNPHPVIGRISVPRLGFAVSMVEGDDDESLEVAAGHMRGTASAGQPGNMVVAGHRDSAFWPLRNIRVGDRITIKEADQSGTYRVAQTHIVQPDDTRDLADSSKSILTLVTCYPFRHIGPAPQRFVVRAELIR